MKYLIVVVGPTAVGKTALSIELAKHFGTEVISADSRQFYQEMKIGTAKPTPEEMGEVVHHFVNDRSVTEGYDVGAFEKDALNLLDTLFQSQKVVVMTGGSGLFVDAVCRGFDELPEVTAAVREELRSQLASGGIEPLREELQQVDPAYYAEVDIQNPQRVIRALEVCRSTGKPFSTYRKGKKVERPFQIVKVGLNMDRGLLYERIDTRMDLMISQGLFEEAEALLPHRELNALQTVGYREVFGHLDGDYDRDEAIRLLKRNSRRYAKRQLTWFRRDENTQWFEPKELTTMIEYLEGKVALEGSEPKN